jgi:hypothetical protein
MTRLPNSRPISQPHTLERIAEYPGVVTISGWQNLRIVSWAAQADGPAVDELFVAMERSQDFPKYSWVHLIRDKLGLPDAAARAGFARMMTERSNELACIAVVVGGTGFWASAMRNAVIGLRAFTPRKFELRLHGTIDEVVTWLPSAHARETQVELPVSALRDWLKQAQELEPVSRPSFY